ncbi:DNA-directed RNA polymerase subunit P [Candidatus Woesearchaeota archaeon]|nr:DNA-directed RNA polymerase subunit P [Candidatus Woesearchaeota archaeon]MDP3639905.1 DNA-directed RNA polymerase subunit P [Nanoarchaeota archaeon]HLC97748.1 DNA-directed RNA polymerase subunit P [Candidatus Nanoarchaeia archaeon]
MYYVCFDCGKHVEDEYTKTKVRCPYCGGKVLYKDRRTVTKVKAR